MRSQGLNTGCLVLRARRERVGHDIGRGLACWWSLVIVDSLRYDGAMNRTLHVAFLLGVCV